MTETFYIGADGSLIRTVEPNHSRRMGRPPGEPYTHRCSLAVLETVAHAINETRTRDGGVFCLDDLVAATGLPHSQTNVALAFLKERGTVVPAGIGRKHTAAKNADVFIDAMTEYHAMREGSKDGAD